MWEVNGELNSTTSYIGTSSSYIFIIDYSGIMKILFINLYFCASDTSVSQDRITLIRTCTSSCLVSALEFLKLPITQKRWTVCFSLIKIYNNCELVNNTIFMLFIVFFSKIRLLSIFWESSCYLLMMDSLLESVWSK